MPPVSTTELEQLDAHHVWHPYAALPSTPRPLLVTSAQGVHLHLADGRELVDAMSSWWCAIHGYRHPMLDVAIRNQLEMLPHVMFGGLTHEPAIRLAEGLVDITPEGLEHVFFSDSGSVAVEVAIKMALQYWQGKGDHRRTRLLSARGGYHGDTFMTMSVGDWAASADPPFPSAMPAQLFVRRPAGGFQTPVDELWVRELRLLITRHAPELAAVIVEPVVQGAGGMHIYNPEYLRVLRDECDEHGLLLILDEIATGFGRTGQLFAADHANIAPDIMCVGKALTGGYLSMAATLCTARVAAAVSSGPERALLHGPTFMANPLAASVAIASLDLLKRSDWAGAVARIEAKLREGLQCLVGECGVADVRALGAIGVVELTTRVDVAAATLAAKAAGVWLRPFRNLIYTMPPYVSSDADVAQICQGIIAAVRACT